MSAHHIFVCDGMSIKQIRIGDGQFIRSIYLQQSHPNSICISPDEQFLYVAYETVIYDNDYDISIDKFRVEDGSLLPMDECEGNHICISHDGKLLFISRQYNNEIQVVETENGSNVRTIQLHRQIIGGSMCLSPCGEFLFVADNRNMDTQIHILNIYGDYEDYNILHIPNISVDSICISSDGEFLFTSNKFNNRIEVLSVEDGSIVGTIPCGRVDSICIYNQEIFTRSSNSLVYVFQA